MVSLRVISGPTQNVHSLLELGVNSAGFPLTDKNTSRRTWSTMAADGVCAHFICRRGHVRGGLVVEKRLRNPYAYWIQEAQTTRLV